MAANTAFAAGAVSYTGVNQTTPLGTAASNKGKSTTASVSVSSAAGELVVDAVGRRSDVTSNPISPGAGQTQRWNTHTGANSATNGATGGASEKAGAATVPMSWTWSGSIEWAIAGVSLKPAPDTTPPVRSGGAPSGSLPAGTTGTTLALATNENATCRYSTTAGVSYAAMTHTFGSTGGTNHSESLTGLSDGTAYTYYVRCSDTAGNANTDDYVISFSVASPPDTTPPSKPANVHAATIESHEVGLAWDASTDNIGVAGYDVYRDSAFIASTSATSYTDATVAASTTYAYTVVAYDAAGNHSSASDPLSVTTLSGDVTDPVISNIAVSGIATSSATVSWDTDESSTSKVEYGLTVGYGLSASSSALTLTHSLHLSSLEPGATYHYQVVSRDAAGNESASTDRTFTTVAVPDTTPPHAISDLAIAGGSESSLDLTWTAPSDDPGAAVGSYDIRYSTALITDTNWASATPATGAPTPSAPGAVETYTLVGLLRQTTYYVAIRSEDGVGNISALSNVVSGATSASVPSSTGSTNIPKLPPPAAFTAHPEDEQVSLSWKNLHCLGYVRTVILRKVGSAPQTPKDGKRIYEGKLEQFTDLGLTDGIDYYYAAFAIGLEGNTSPLMIVKATPREGIEAEQIMTYATSSSLSEAGEASTTQVNVATAPLALPLLRDLHVGSVGDDVSWLQAFLAGDASWYPSGLVTGYYGALTEGAVEKFQCAHVIVCSGSAASTGFGRVGAQTRAVIHAHIGS